MNKLSKILETGKILVSDGAWGTYLFKKGLVSGDCPEAWNLTHYEDVLDIAKSYVDAGSDIISTNSFGANVFKLSQYNLSEKLSEICQVFGRDISQASWCGKNSYGVTWVHW